MTIFHLKAQKEEELDVVKQYSIPFKLTRA